MTDSNTSASNYDKKQVEKMLSTYDAKATQEERDAQIRELEAVLGKKSNSIIAKLSSLGVYVAKVRTTKTGGKVVQKSAIVSNIASLVGQNATKFASFSKATKADLLEFETMLTALVTPAKEESEQAETVAETVAD